MINMVERLFLYANKVGAGHSDLFCELAFGVNCVGLKQLPPASWGELCTQVVMTIRLTSFHTTPTVLLNMRFPLFASQSEGDKTHQQLPS